MPPLNRKSLNAKRRRALELLAKNAHGATEGFSHGFTVDFIVDIVRARLATAKSERMRAGGQAIEVTRVESQTLVGGRSRRTTDEIGHTMAPLILKRASTSRPLGEWNDDDYDVLADGSVVGRILKVHAAPVGTPWMWTLAYGQHEDRTPRHGYKPTREAAIEDEWPELVHKLPPKKKPRG